MLTMGLAGDSKSMIMAGDELTVADSGDVLRRGTSRFAQMEAPPLDYFSVDNHRDTAELCSHSMVQGVASNDDAVSNSGEFARSDVENKEILGGVEMV
jgi:hypothetical protein